jgi:hypothetical protein
VENGGKIQELSSECFWQTVVKNRVFRKRCMVGWRGAEIHAPHTHTHTHTHTHRAIQEREMLSGGYDSRPLRLNPVS